MLLKRAHAVGGGDGSAVYKFFREIFLHFLILQFLAEGFQRAGEGRTENQQGLFRGVSGRGSCANGLNNLDGVSKLLSIQARRWSFSDD